MTRGIFLAKKIRIHFIPGGKKINGTIFINLFSRKDFVPWSEKGLFWFSTHSPRSQMEGARRRWKTVKNLWSHFGIIAIYCSWMTRGFFIRTNKHKNMFLYFSLPFLLRGKVRDSFGKFSLSPSCMNRTFHCCPFSGWESFFSLPGQMMIPPRVRLS